MVDTTAVEAALWHVAEERWFASEDATRTLIESRLLVDLARERLERCESELSHALQAAHWAREDLLNACNLHEQAFAAWGAAREAA